MIYNSRKYKLFVRFSFIISFVFALILGVLLSVIALNLGYWSVSTVIAVALVAVVFFLYLFFSSVAKYWKMGKITKKEFPEEWEKVLREYVEFYNGLDDEDRTKFKQKILLFLSEKKISGIETEIDDRVKLLIAASAVIPVFNLDDWEYDDISEILVYPGRFDNDYRFDGSNHFLGMVTGKGGVIIISKQDIIEGFKHWEKGRNVGIHEFAHKIDGGDGYIDGIPFLIMDENLAKEWRRVRSDEIEKIKKGESDIDPYATRSNAEYFAVSCEYFFSNPVEFGKKHPELYNLLKKIFKIDTRSIIKEVVKNMFSGG